MLNKSPGKSGKLLRIAASLILVLVVLPLLLLWYVNSRVDERHRPLAGTETFNSSSATFAQYTDWAQRRLQQARGPAATAELIARLAPFRLEPAADCPAGQDRPFLNGIVLTHDLLDSPYSLREIAAYFQSRCFLVLVPLLPGHGTRPGDFLLAGWQDWAATVAFATAQVVGEADNVYLGGHGAGATLAILEAAGNPAVDSLILFAPALGAVPGPWYEALVAPLSRWVPGLAWSELRPDEALYRYESRPYSYRTEATALIRATEQALAARSVELPVFTVASMEDRDVSTAAILEFMAANAHPASRTLLFSQHELAAASGVTVISSHMPASKVLSITHGVMIPLHDPEYGWDARWRDCSHYYSTDSARYDACKAGGRDLLGEATRENLRQGVLERIGFNPWYFEMLAAIDAFIAPVARITPRQLL